MPLLVIALALVCLNLGFALYAALRDQASAVVVHLSLAAILFLLAGR